MTVRDFFTSTTCYAEPNGRESRERIRRKTYSTRDRTRQHVFDYIEMFYNPKRRHSFSNDLSPMEYEKQYFQRLSSV